MSKNGLKIKKNKFITKKNFNAKGGGLLLKKPHF